MLFLFSYGFLSFEQCAFEAAQNDDDDEMVTAAQSYYNTAHRYREKVLSQPPILAFGKLKEYQVSLGFDFSFILLNMDVRFADERTPVACFPL